MAGAAGAAEAVAAGAGALAAGDGAGRGDAAGDARKKAMERVLRCAAQIHGERYYCPDGGRYALSADGKQVVCEHHGSRERPRQAAAPSTGTKSGRLLNKFGGVTASITLTEEGLRAVLSVEYDRKK